MKTLFKVLASLAFLAAAAYGVLRFIDRIDSRAGENYVEFPCCDEDED